MAYMHAGAASLPLFSPQPPPPCRSPTAPAPWGLEIHEMPPESVELATTGVSESAALQLKAAAANSRVVSERGGGERGREGEMLKGISSSALRLAASHVTRHAAAAAPTWRLRCDAVVGSQLGKWATPIGVPQVLARAMGSGPKTNGSAKVGDRPRCSRRMWPGSSSPWCGGRDAAVLLPSRPHPRRPTPKPTPAPAPTPTSAHAHVHAQSYAHTHAYARVCAHTRSRPRPHLRSRPHPRSRPRSSSLPSTSLLPSAAPETVQNKRGGQGEAVAGGEAAQRRS